MLRKANIHWGSYHVRSFCDHKIWAPTLFLLLYLSQRCAINIPITTMAMPASTKPRSFPMTNIGCRLPLCCCAAGGSGVVGSAGDLEVVTSGVLAVSSGMATLASSWPVVNSDGVATGAMASLGVVANSGAVCSKSGWFSRPNSRRHS